MPSWCDLAWCWLVNSSHPSPLIVTCLLCSWVGSPLEAGRLQPGRPLLEALWGHCQALLARRPPAQPDADDDEWNGGWEAYILHRDQLLFNMVFSGAHVPKQCSHRHPGQQHSHLSAPHT